MSKAPTVQEKRKIAILTIHGMGTHLPLTGIQDMVKVVRRVTPGRVEPSSEVIEIEGSRVVLSKAVVSGDEGEVTVFEANYSAIPKGTAGVKDVIMFLFNAGWNGLGANNWPRWLFGHLESCRPKNFTHFSLLTVIAALVSLLGLNALFTAELFSPGSVQYATFASQPTRFQIVLSTAMVVILMFAGVFGLLTLLSRWRSKEAAKTGRTNGLHKAVSSAGFVAFVLLPIIVVAMTIYVGLRKIWPVLPLDEYLQKISFTFIVVRILGAAVLVALLAKLVSNRPIMFKVWLVVLGLGILLLMTLEVNVKAIVFDPKVTSVDFWILGAGFMAASFVFKGFLLDYVGDVTAYISGSQASKFAEVRERVQARVRGVLELLVCEGYDVIVFAHSLGAVVGYDVVNRVLLANPKASIRAFVTYGSPLDKIAYLFRTEAHHGDALRDHLVGTRQPLLDEDVRTRIPWWNVQAKYDIIGSRTAFYNSDTSGNTPLPTDVLQIDDSTNLTPVASHGAYSDHGGLAEAYSHALAHVAQG